MMEGTLLLALPEGMLIDQIQPTEIGLAITVISTNEESCCPLCSQASPSVHSHYQRTLSDIPCTGQSVQLCFAVRRFYCYTFEKTLQRLAREELRFPTSDEWEYACSAGTRTLFRWGNRTPPVSIPHLGTHKAEGWDLHLRQNAFGLLIARNPYQWEMCSEPGLMRGGDGGVALHAGAGTFAAWLTLASAFHHQLNREHIYLAHLRRAFSLC